MGAFAVSAILVALAEIGDRTQLLSLVLAVKHRKPLVVLSGIFLATLANHLLAAWLGSYAGHWMGANLTRWVVGLGSIAFAVWILRPDEISDEGDNRSYSNSAFLNTLVWFFIAEIGDKTEIATAGLATRFPIQAVVAGSVFGLFVVNVPTVLVGAALGTKIPVRLFRYCAAGVSLVLGFAVLSGYGLAQ